MQPFDSFPRLLNLWPPTPPQMPPGVLRGDLELACVHSQMDLQMCAKFGANRSSRLTASQDFWICDTLTPPPNATWGIEGRLVFSLCPFPDESADVNQSWCQSDRQDFWIVDLLKPPPPSAPPPPLCVNGQFVWRISIPIWICTCVPNLVPIGPAVWSLFTNVG